MSLSPRRVIFNPVLSIRRASRPSIPQGDSPPPTSPPPPRDIESSGQVPTKIPFWRTRHGSWITALGIILVIAVILGGVFGSRASKSSSHSSDVIHKPVSVSFSHTQQPSGSQYLTTLTLSQPPNTLTDDAEQTSPSSQDDPEPTPPPAPPPDPTPPVGDPVPTPAPQPPSLPSSDTPVSSSTIVPDAGSSTTQPGQGPQSTVVSTTPPDSTSVSLVIP
ncbi:hypothetical protein BDN72DRAFT_900119 [Pluteus cervinus]|uniref:Uncharacterized protein n=1 Tax=Pluteus cervinus TaxID=181527 RepID=A0ACD3AKX2_9AGAR|nr:hypothetical protein BDN72DRAFT_900119 [Pluteus cervinus]